MRNGSGSATEVLQPGTRPIQTSPRVRGMGPAVEMQPKVEADPLAEAGSQESKVEVPSVVTLEMLPDEDLLAIASSELEELPEPDKKTGVVSRDNLIAALTAAGITEVDTE